MYNLPILVKLRNGLIFNKNSPKFSNYLFKVIYIVNFLFPDHSAVIDPDEYNKKYFARTEELWDSIESSRWWKDD